MIAVTCAASFGLSASIKYSYRLNTFRFSAALPKLHVSPGPRIHSTAPGSLRLSVPLPPFLRIYPRPVLTTAGPDPPGHLYPLNGICCARFVYSAPTTPPGADGVFGVSGASRNVGSTRDMIFTGVPGLTTTIDPRGQIGPCLSSITDAIVQSSIASILPSRLRKLKIPIGLVKLERRTVRECLCVHRDNMEAKQLRIRWPVPGRLGRARRARFLLHCVQPVHECVVLIEHLLERAMRGIILNLIFIWIPPIVRHQITAKGEVSAWKVFSMIYGPLLPHWPTLISQSDKKN